MKAANDATAAASADATADLGAATDDTGVIVEPPVDGC